METIYCETCTRIGSSHLLVNITQRWRYLYALLDREGQAVTLSLPVVRVLPDYHDLHGVEGRKVEGGEHLGGGGYTVLRDLVFGEGGERDGIMIEDYSGARI